MPTKSDPESPFLSAQVDAALGGRTPGTPSTAGKPTPQAADFRFPAPPGPAAAPGGRPKAQAIPTPLAPVAPAPAAPTPSAAGPGLPDAGKPIEGGVEGAKPAPEAEAAVAVADTQHYREAVMQTRLKLGPIPSVFRHASLPEMPAEPDMPNWNPFTGIWA